MELAETTEDFRNMILEIVEEGKDYLEWAVLGLQESWSLFNGYDSAAKTRNEENEMVSSWGCYCWFCT